jgi:hypothetical protein
MKLYSKSFFLFGIIIIDKTLDLFISLKENTFLGFLGLFGAYLRIQFRFEAMPRNDMSLFMIVRCNWFIGFSE